MRAAPADAAAIRLLVVDVDGVMTDGRLYFGPRGEVFKAFNVRDGLGLRTLAAVGVEIAVISGRSSPAVAARCRDLGIKHVTQGAENKLPALKKLLARLDVPAAQCACIGDDVVDVPLFEIAGLAFAVADAHDAARRAAHIVTKLKGGRGAVREVCDFLLAARRGNPRVSRRSATTRRRRA